MSPRPRTVSDDEILAATSRVIGRVGPVRATLGLIAAEVGLAPATLVQRFGSKRGLLLALGRAGEPDPGAALSGLRRAHDSPLAALRDFLLCFCRMAPSPDELANHLAAYHMDVVDPELRAVTRAIGEENEATVRELLTRALAAGEIAGCSPRRLAPVLLALTQGSLLAWAVFRRGTSRSWLTRDLETALAPYLASRRRTAGEAGSTRERRRPRRGASGERSKT